MHLIILFIISILTQSVNRSMFLELLIYSDGYTSMAPCSLAIGQYRTLPSTICHSINATDKDNKQIEYLTA